MDAYPQRRFATGEELHRYIFDDSLPFDWQPERPQLTDVVQTESLLCKEPNKTNYNRQDVVAIDAQKLKEENQKTDEKDYTFWHLSTLRNVIKKFMGIHEPKDVEVRVLSTDEVLVRTLNKFFIIILFWLLTQIIFMNVLKFN